MNFEDTMRKHSLAGLLFGIVLILVSVFALAGLATAGDLSLRWSDTVTLADPGTDIRDTVETDPHPLLPYGLQYVYYGRSLYITDVDTVFGGDTLYAMTYTSPLRAGPWTLFDSTKVILPSSLNDTTIVLQGMELDSAATTINAAWMKLVGVNGYTLGTTSADTALIDNVYDYHVSMFFFGRYTEPN